MEIFYPASNILFPQASLKTKEFKVSQFQLVSCELISVDVALRAHKIIFMFPEPTSSFVNKLMNSVENGEKKFSVGWTSVLTVWLMDEKRCVSVELFVNKFDDCDLRFCISLQQNQWCTLPLTRIPTSAFRIIY